MQPTGFYVGKKGAIYAQLENGSMARLGLRVSGGKLVAFDPLRREWIELPTRIPDRSAGWDEAYPLDVLMGQAAIALILAAGRIARMLKSW